MATKTKSKKTSRRNIVTSATVRTSNAKSSDFFTRITKDFSQNRSYLNLILGAIIIIVVAVLLINFLKKQSDTLTTSQPQDQNQTAQTDISGAQKYTVKAGDTLYTISEDFYKDGFKYPELMQANNIADENVITEGQILTIPAASAATPTPAAATDQGNTKTLSTSTQSPNLDQNPAQWGEKITTDSYTVQEGDWLSTIAARAYGDIYSFDKIAQANNIPDPDNIEVGTVLKIPK